MAADAVAHVEGGEAVEVPPADADGRFDAALGEDCDNAARAENPGEMGREGRRGGGDKTYVYI